MRSCARRRDYGRHGTWFVVTGLHCACRPCSLRPRKLVHHSKTASVRIRDALRHCGVAGSVQVRQLDFKCKMKATAWSRRLAVAYSGDQLARGQGTKGLGVELDPVDLEGEPAANRSVQ